MSRIGAFADDDAAAWVVKSPDIGVAMAGFTNAVYNKNRLPMRVRELARRVFVLCGCSGLARCDFFVDGDDVLVNELNTIPGFTETSVYGKLFEADGIPYPELCDRLIKFAIERYESTKRYEF